MVIVCVLLCIYGSDRSVCVPSPSILEGLAIVGTCVRIFSGTCLDVSFQSISVEIEVLGAKEIEKKSLSLFLSAT